MKKQKKVGNEIRFGLFGALQRNMARCMWTAVAMVFAVSVQAAPPGPGGKKSFETMTVNLYIGGGIARVVALDPTDPNYLTQLVTAVTGVYYEILGSQPQVRIAGVANSIVAKMPDVVSVEEGTLLRVQSPGDLALGGTSPATNVVFDYVQMLVDQLEARGAHYAVVSSSDEWDIEMPMMNMQTGGIDDIRQTDREAILVRTDLPRGQLRATNPRDGNFANLITFPSMGFSLTRGWCSVDLFVRGETFRYISAHLEEETSPQIQVLQANELLRGPARTCLPVMIVGDFNSDPLHRDGSIAYDTFSAAGLHDAWAALHRNNLSGGLTWGHDELLADTSVLFDRRIDFAFYRGCSFIPSHAEVLDMWLGRNTAPLWASDHAALDAEFQLH